MQIDIDLFFFLKVNKDKKNVIFYSSIIHAKDL